MKEKYRLGSSLLTAFRSHWVLANNDSRDRSHARVSHGQIQLGAHLYGPLKIRTDIWPTEIARGYTSVYVMSSKLRQPVLWKSGMFSAHHFSFFKLYCLYCADVSSRCEVV